MGTLTNGLDAFEACSRLKYNSVLDVGAGNGFHAKLFKDLGKDVKTVDFKNADFNGDYLNLNVGQYDLIWCCHVLEHQPNVNQFLKKIYVDLNDWLVITVPPSKSDIVGGHLTLWNAGLLFYNLILAGFDCSQARVKTYGYNISIIVKKKHAVLPELNYDFGDIERLNKFFPFDAKQGFDGNIEELNW